MTRSCKRCQPASVPGILERRHVVLLGGMEITEWISLCAPCREQAERENQAARAR